MTYALGVKCTNGVVLITDRKLTVDEGASQDFVDKIDGDIYGVLWAYAGTTGTFELFRNSVRDFVQNNPKTTVDGFIVKLSEITHKIIEDFQYYFGQYEVLVAISGRKTSDGKSALKHIYDAGKIEPINKFKSIGGGAPYGSVYLQEFLREKKMITMNQAAELGYFIIKYIEKFQLDNTVGLDDKNCKYKHPQIHFIPDNEPDYPCPDVFLESLADSTKTRLERVSILEPFGI